MAFEQLINELNRLQRRLYESYREFNTTQDNLDDAQLVDYFYQQAIQRKQYYEAIRERIKVLGEIPKNVTRPFGDAADEIFTDIKSVFSSEDDKMILQEAKLTEQRLLGAYDQVLAVATVRPELQEILETQRAEVARDLQQISTALDRVS